MHYRCLWIHASLPNLSSRFDTDIVLQFMTLQKMLELLKTAPDSQIDKLVKKKINEVNSENEESVRELFQYIYESGFYGNVTPFVVAMVDPKYTKDYPLK